MTRATTVAGRTRSSWVTSTRCVWSAGSPVRPEEARCPAATRSGTSGSSWSGRRSGPGPGSRSTPWTARSGRPGASGRSDPGRPATSSRWRAPCGGGSTRQPAGKVSRYEIEVARGKAHSSRSERMRTPGFGLGWNEVAFSGSSRSAAATRSTTSTSGAGIRTAVPPVRRSWLSAESTEWWWWIRAGPRGSAGTTSSCRASTAARSAGRSSLRVAQVAAVGDDQGLRAQGAERGRAVGDVVPDADRLGRRGEVVELDAGQHAVDRPEEQRGVLLVDQHRQAAVERAARVAGLHPQVGRIAVVPVGDQRPAAGQAVGEGGEASRGRGSPRSGAAARAGRRTRRSARAGDLPDQGADVARGPGAPAGSGPG